MEEIKDPAKKTVSADTQETPATDKRLQDAAPMMSFSTFVFSLSTSALIHMGEIDNPVTKKREKDLALAKNSIDIMAMLKEKTAGNLNETEAALIEGSLRDLRMLYVRASG